MNTAAEEVRVPNGPVFFSFAGEYRRVGIYLIVGGSLFVAIGIGLYQFNVFPPDRAHVLPFVAFFPLSMVGGGIFLLRHRLQVNDRGISRRRIFFRDLWPWEAFAGQEIKEGSGQDSFVYPAKSWWNRYLLLGFLEAKDQQEVVAIIRRHWQRPELPPIPDDLKIGWGYLRRWVRLSKEGIELGKWKQPQGSFHSWNEVRQVRLTRHDHSRRDLSDLELDLPGSNRPIGILRNHARDSWKGVNPEILAAYIERVVPADRLLIIARTGPPRTVAEAEFRIADLDRFASKHNKGRWFLNLWVGITCSFALLFLPFCLIFGFNDFAKMGVLFFFQGCLGLLMFLIPDEATKQIQESRSELVAWRESLKTIAIKDSEPRI